MALTGVAADLRAGATQAIVRRVLSVAAMFGGAVTGALLVIHADTVWALAIAVGVLLMVSVISAYSKQPVDGRRVAAAAGR
jgi:hypothetical protein